MLRLVTAQLGLGLVALLVSATPSCAEEAGPVQVEQGADQQDIYYDAMLRSIELDRSRWKSFSRSLESGPWFYDVQSLKREGNRVTVLVTVYPHPNRTELYRSIHHDHAKIRKIDFVTEIDCSRHAYRQPQIRVFGYYRELLAEHSSEGANQGFSPIKPDTTTDTLRGLVCAPEKKKRK